MRSIGLLAVLAIVLLLFSAAAKAETVRFDQAMYGGVKRDSGRVTIKPGKKLYLRFAIPEGWSAAQLVLDPRRSSSSLRIKPMTGRWRKGLFSGAAPAGQSQFSGVFAAQKKMQFNSLRAGAGLTLKLSLSSGRTYLARLPYLDKVVSQDGDNTNTDNNDGGGDNPAVAPVQIAAVGDIACSPSDGSFNGGAGTATACAQSRVASLVSSSDQKILLLGDIQYPAGALADYQNGFGPSWSGLAARLKPAPGNHDYGSGNINDYLSYFASLGVETGGSNGYYAFTSGNWRIISLNSNCTQVACSPGSTQEQWLRGQLQAAKVANQCTLAYWHHPRASGGLHGDQTDVDGLWRAMVDEGGDLVLAGHDHHYERFEPLDGAANPDPAGLASFIVGSGGVNLRSVVPRNGSAKTITNVFGLLRLSLTQSGYSYQWVGESGLGSDSGSGNCR